MSTGHNPDLAARRAAAAAVLADFTTAIKTAPLTKPPNMFTWAMRLRDTLAAVLDALDQAGSQAVQGPGLAGWELMPGRRSRMRSGGGGHA